MRSRFALVLACALPMAAASAGCSAIYSSDRAATDTTAPAPDQGADADVPSPDTTPTDGVVPDKAAPSEGAIAKGSWEGRSGDHASGSAELYRTATGDIEVRFGADFDSTQVPGPKVVLSTRDALGSSIDASKGDIDLGALKSATGAQTYPLPNGDQGQRYLWVFCEPFGVEIGRAQLVDVN